MTARRPLTGLPPISEEAFLAQVIALARLLDWMVFHARPGRTSKGWRTPVQGDGAGFVDCVLVRGPTLLFAELKSQRGRLRRNQELWINLLRQAGQRVYVWTPNDFPAIQEILENG